MHRRDFLKAAGRLALAGGALPLGAGCARRPRHPPERPQLILFSRWTAGGDAAALASLLNLYQLHYPGRQVNATLPGGVGTNYKALLKNRMLGGDPPDTFQVHGGSELIDTWVRTRYLEPITDLWRVEGWPGVFPHSLVDLVSLADEIYAVPANVHRANLLWYHRQLFEREGLAPTTTFDAFFAVAETLRARGILPLALASRERWEVSHLFEAVLLGVAGPDFYRDLFAGRVAWTDGQVRAALAMLDRVLAYVNPNHATLTWDHAAGLVLRGQAAMTVMGDWTKGFFTANQWVPDEDFGAVPTRDTQGHFIVVTDTFGLPRGIAGRAVTIAFLQLLGSVHGQNAFNPKKGSIPARADVQQAALRAAPDGPYDPIALGTMEDFSRDVLLPSSASGAASPEAFAEAIDHALVAFVEHRDADATMRRLERLAQGLSVRQ